MDRILALAVRPLQSGTRLPRFRICEDTCQNRLLGDTGKNYLVRRPPPLECWPKALLFTALWLLSSGTQGAYLSVPAMHS
jgi:hypothetical protein